MNIILFTIENILKDLCYTINWKEILPLSEDRVSYS